MFTGLVEDVGQVVAVAAHQGGLRLRIRTRIPLSEVKIGDSIATDGVCLTAERVDGDCFEALAGRETLAVTSLRDVRVGRAVHLERALRMGDRLGGHMVAGHVDGTGRVVASHNAGESWILWIEVPSALSRYVVPKGSLTVDGVSLTVNEVSGDQVRLNLVPHTVAVTRLGALRPGDDVNLETDLIARYVERLLGRSASLDLDTLRRHGFAE